MEAKTLLDYIFASFWRDYKEYVEAEENFRNSLDDRFSYFYNILKDKNCLPEVKIVSTKSVRHAIEFRKLGDQAFCDNRFVEAIRLYTKSAAAALPGSVELASAFANRSAALYKLERYTAALVDVNRALLGSYPDKSKLLLRRESCVYRLQRSDQKISSFLSVVEKLAKTMDPLLGSSASSTSSFEFDSEIADINYEYRFPLPPENYPKPTKLPFVRKTVKVKYNEQFGRHIVAANDIKPGETIGMEKPFASALALDYRYSHCANCYVKSEALIPCSTCSMLMFCGKQCRDSAYNRYHRVECKILYNVGHFDIRDDVWLAVRMLIIATKQGEELKKLMNHPIYKNPMNIDRSHIPSEFGTHDYLDLHNLEDNADKASFEENYTLGFTAALIVHILKQSDFFDEKKEPGKKKVDNVNVDLSSKENFAGKLLLKFLFVVKHNAFKITENLRDDNKKIKFITLDIGSSIYIFHSYFNHSCDENGTKCFHKDVIVSRSVQLIHAGEQIFLDYGANFGTTSRSYRLEYLRDEYKFDCTCQACQFDWPLLVNTNAATMPKLKRNSISSDSLKVLIGKTRDLRKTATMSYDRAKYDLLCNHMETYHKSVKKPWREYYDCQQKLKEIHSTGANHYHLKFDGFLVYL